jgi:hypothetical protein
MKGTISPSKCMIQIDIEARTAMIKARSELEDYVLGIGARLLILPCSVPLG